MLGRGRPGPAPASASISAVARAPGASAWNARSVWVTATVLSKRPVASREQTVAEIASGPVQRILPFVETVKWLERLASGTRRPAAR